jgi:SAM-dependent methyltransferase
MPSWPRTSAISSMGTPAAESSEVHEWRSSFGVHSPSPAAVVAFRNSRRRSLGSISALAFRLFGNNHGRAETPIHRGFSSGIERQYWRSMLSMSHSEHARVAEAYSRRLGDLRLYDGRRPDVVASAAARARAWGFALWNQNRPTGRFLDVGCGNGGVLAWARSAGATSLVGADLLRKRLQPGRWPGGPGGLVVADATRLPFRDGAFETVACATLFSSILDDEVAIDAAREISRVTESSGVVLWHDMTVRNPSNSDVRHWRRSDIQRLFPDRRPSLKRTVLAPPIGRRIINYQWLSDLLALAPFLLTHLSGALLERSREVR